MASIFAAILVAIGGSLAILLYLIERAMGKKPPDINKFDLPNVHRKT